MKFDSVSDIGWLINYILPISAIFAIYRTYKHFLGKSKRKSALRKKVVVITGASSGLGEALAHAFYNEGSQVVLAARRVDELERVKQDLLAENSETSTLEPIVIKLDLRKADHIADFAREVHDKCGQIDILVNNAGISFRGTVLETEIDVIKQIMDINFFGTVALTKAFLPEMVKNRSGHILFVSSVQGLVALPDRSAYGASKHALQAFCDSLRAELSQYNIYVTVVSPGYLKTNLSINALTASGTKHGKMDASTQAGYTCEYAAEKIIDSIIDKKEELIVSQFTAHVAILLRRFAPKVYFWTMSSRANKVSKIK